MWRLFVLSLVSCVSLSLYAQSPTCPYPILLMHGWTGSNESWDEFYQDQDVEDIYGVFDENDQVFWAMPNATDTHDYYTDCCTFLCFFDCEYIVDSTRNDDVNGPDGVFNNNPTDDDVQWVFPNENNQLNPGCLYAYSFNVGKNNDGTIFKNPTFSSTAPCDDCSDNNEAAPYKQGYALKRAIEAVLAANPTKDKVILMAHSMGGLCGREYLQRQDANGNPQWWIDSTSSDGHKVAKFVTFGTPHRGSNTLGNFTFDGPNNRNDLPDLQSEGIRDLRYSYEDGTLGDDVPGTYLYGGLESDIPDFAFDYWSNDVNCDGDDDDLIQGMNIDGNDQGFSDAWDGTTDNPLMPLPTNIKYTYYVSDADGAVDEIRQWLYLGGNGSTSDFNSGSSHSVPNDGVDHRRSDRINSSRFHLNQTSDIDNVSRAMDEPDYPELSYVVDLNTWYFGLAQKRADQVPMESDYSLLGNNEIDGDFYVVDLVDTVYNFIVNLIPHPDLSGRIDIFSNVNDLLTNNLVPDTSLSWPINSDTLLLTSIVDNYLPGQYYIRISHDVFSTSGSVEDVWKTPYYFRVQSINPCIDILALDDQYHADRYSVSHSILSAGLVNDSGYLHVQAGQDVELLPGFEVGQQAEFTAKIDTCQ